MIMYARPSLRSRLIAACFALALGLICLGFANTAKAEDCVDCACSEAAQQQEADYFTQEQLALQKFFGTVQPIMPRGRGQAHGTGEIGRDERWWIDTFFIGNVLPAMQMMTEQLVTVMMNQMLSIGSVMDAKEHLETELLYQKLTAQAHKDYQTSMGMCTIGTNVLSLAAAERNGEMTSGVLAAHSTARSMGNGQVSGAEGDQGENGDRTDRLAKFAATFCDFDDNDRLDTVAATGLYMICNRKAHNTNQRDMFNLNRDIDFTRAVADPDTIDMSMTDTRNSPADAIFAMKNNLYGSDLSQRISNEQIKLDAASDEVVDYRAIAAKRSVAEHSFESIVAMKAMGTPAGAGGGRGSADTLKYMTFIMRDLGIPEQEVQSILGAQPSYFAQLKFLAKRIYQDPQFYVELYDTPANVQRKRVAMQAINSIIEREIYNSYMRSEAMLSQILELHVAIRQKRAEDSIPGLGKR